MSSSLKWKGFEVPDSPVDRVIRLTVALVVYKGIITREKTVEELQRQQRLNPKLDILTPENINKTWHKVKHKG